jgi:hypothetical protein
MIVINSPTAVERDHMRWYFNDGGEAAAAAKLRFGLRVGVAQGVDCADE